MDSTRKLIDLIQVLIGTGFNVSSFSRIKRLIPHMIDWESEYGDILSDIQASDDPELKYVELYNKAINSTAEQTDIDFTKFEPGNMIPSELRDNELLSGAVETWESSASDLRKMYELLEKRKQSLSEFDKYEWMVDNPQEKKNKLEQLILEMENSIKSKEEELRMSNPLNIVNLHKYVESEPAPHMPDGTPSYLMDDINSQEIDQVVKMPSVSKVK